MLTKTRVCHCCPGSAQVPTPIAHCSKSSGAHYLLALLVAGLVVASAAPAQVVPHPQGTALQDLKRELRSAITPLPHAQTRAGICVVDLVTGATVFSRKADEPLTPASTMKVFAMAAALVELGRDFTFETVFATNGRNLFVVGDGDPAFGDEKLHGRRDEKITADFERWADALLERGTGSIAGDLIIDESIFDDRRVHHSWEESDLGNWYAAPAGALNFNDNCIDITVSPAATRGAPVLVMLQPDTSLVKMVNECRSGGSGKPVLHHPSGTFDYRITGRCSKRWRFSPVSFPDPGLLFADSLLSVLTRKGITVAGTIRRERVRKPDGDLPGSLHVVATRTTPLADVLRRAGKDSQNLFAECLLKRAGYAWARRHGVPDPQGSRSLGKKTVLELIERSGIDTRGLVVADGSGLSRDNTCTARQLAGLLAWIYDRPEGRLLYDSLSVAGVDGSLRKRLKDIPGRVVAKTGTMRGVRTLAGYVDAVAGPRYAFAVLFNGYKGPSTPYREIQDRVCRILVDAAMRQAP